MHLAYGMPMFDPRLLRAKNGAPGLTPAMGSLTLVCAGAIEPPSAGGGALGVLLPPMKGSFPAGMEPITSQQTQRDSGTRGVLTRVSGGPLIRLGRVRLALRPARRRQVGYRRRIGHAHELPKGHERLSLDTQHGTLVLAILADDDTIRIVAAQSVEGQVSLA